ncbi:MAG: hypothetical protein H7061_08775 [Bdellovibrionaceae bacterium]|nr:hypothetical protein [Bdellovibrio sp.]
MKVQIVLLIFSLFTMNGVAATKKVKPAPAPAVLQFTPEAILAEVLKKKNLELRPQLPLPKLNLQSQTSLKKFQDDIEPQWNMRPDVFTNAYAFKTNQIFLMDQAAYYKKTNRCIDDSLAHELMHYVQVMYQNADLADESLESEAVDIQTWFRETHCKLPPKALLPLIF